MLHYVSPTGSALSFGEPSRTADGLAAPGWLPCSLPRSGLRSVQLNSSPFWPRYFGCSYSRHTYHGRSCACSAGQLHSQIARGQARKALLRWTLQHMPVLFQAGTALAPQVRLQRRVEPLAAMQLLLTRTIKAFLAMIVMTILCTVVWQNSVTDTLYHCTDSGGLDYLSPGLWVHDPVAVEKVVYSRSMSEPDTIRAGWTMKALWALWFSFVSASVVVSGLLARVPWVPRHRLPETPRQARLA